SDKLGPRTFGDKQELIFLGREISEQKDYSDKTAEVIDNEIDSIIRGCYDTAMKVLTENKEKLIQITETLITRETLEFDELEALFKGEPLPPPKSTETRPPEAKLPEAKSPQPASGAVLKPQPATGGGSLPTFNIVSEPQSKPQ
ncbi:MAG: hypothetical protein NTX46_02815, partial [Chloroflexi bacterium]|nr:hypothetical protein [Chloroflexota bacterium]